MIVAVENIYYQNKMFKPKEALPCYDMKMVQAWLASGVAIDTEQKQKNTASVISDKTKQTKDKVVETEKIAVESESKAEIDNDKKVKTRTKK